MDRTKYIGMDVHKETISIAVMNCSGKLVMESILETKAATLLQFIQGLRGNLQVTFEEGTWAGWLYELLQRFPAGRRPPLGTRESRATPQVKATAPRRAVRTLGFGEIPPCHRQCGLDKLKDPLPKNCKNIQALPTKEISLPSRVRKIPRCLFTTHTLSFSFSHRTQAERFAFPEQPACPAALYKDGREVMPTALAAGPAPAAKPRPNLDMRTFG